MAFAFPPEQIYLWLMVGTVLLFALAAALRHFERRRANRLYVFVGPELAPRLFLGFESVARRPLIWFTVLGFAFLGLALAQPHWGRAWREVSQHSRDIMICLDTSESMNGEDILPNRLERARQKINAMVDACPGDRFGLVAFAGGAALQCPLTLDHGYFKAVLSAVDTDSISLEGTSIAGALEEAARVLSEEKDGQRGTESRAVVLISDGESVDGDAGAKARELGAYARVYVMGVGDPAGAEVRRPTWMSRYVPVSEMAEAHVSRLDETALSQVALEGGGRYVRSTPDDFDIDQLLEHMNGMAGHRADSDLRLRLVNRYQWPLAVAIGCFAAEGFWLTFMSWLRRRRARRTEAQHA